eukprot:240945-Chlamydomonas_euryale.AAC.3
MVPGLQRNAAEAPINSWEPPGSREQPSLCQTQPEASGAAPASRLQDAGSARPPRPPGQPHDHPAERVPIQPIQPERRKAVWAGNDQTGWSHVSLTDVAPTSNPSALALNRR